MDENNNTADNKNKQHHSTKMNLTDEEKLHKREKKLFAMEYIEEIEEDVISHNRDLSNGKFIAPTTENGMIHFTFFKQPVLIKQDTHECGGTYKSLNGQIYINFVVQVIYGAVLLCYFSTWKIK